MNCLPAVHVPAPKPAKTPVSGRVATVAVGDHGDEAKRSSFEAQVVAEAEHLGGRKRKRAQIERPGMIYESI